MGTVVIVAFRPKPGKDEALLDLVRSHTPRLRELGLATEREPTIMQGKDGVIVEVFEWVEGGIERAHEDPQVLAMWGEFAELCDYVPLEQLPEAGDMFAEFTPVSNVA